jgi:hypothetical protein
VQKATLWVESILILVLLSSVLWQRYQHFLKAWWKNWRAKPKRPWTMQPRTPDDCQDCRLAEAEGGPERSQARRRWSEVTSRQGDQKCTTAAGKRA